ncbi:glutamate receptor 2-like [Eriocheir sinensis]|uniref:glutamate receptor 2-like n=1 Tax=Eriocheir sinensis TaxID=95602 RepID=UPI0021C9459A|nr:glutamate receptor 2-like [Eriocheir sinensis]
MNCVLLNLRPAALRGEALVFLPYSPGGRRVVVGVASWTSPGGLAPHSDSQLFPFKFADFHGATIPVTALILPPFWKVVDAGAADSWSKYSGRDCLLMKALARTLNFTFHLDKSSNIDEIMASLEGGRVMLSGFRIMLIPQILERVDHTYFIDRASFAFSMAKPTTRPQWQSLYYPLRPWVWLCILISTVVVLSLMSLVSFFIFYMEDEERGTPAHRSAVLDTLGILLGHDMQLRMSRWTAGFVLVLSWLILAMVVSTGYRGTLTAFLSVPKYPSRPETMEELAKANVRSVFTQNATRFLMYFQESNIPAYRSVGSRVDWVTSVVKGLQQISEQKKAFFHERYNTLLEIAERFTEADGSTPLYVARENVIPNYAAWMMPHDAPYKSDVDQGLLRIIESGLKEKFTDDMLREAWQEIRLKKRDHQEAKVGSSVQTDDHQKSLSMNHMQGAFWILLLGALLASGAFLGELIVAPERLRGTLRIEYMKE